MPENIAGIDVHKKLLVVIIADPAKPGCGVAKPPVRHGFGRIATSVGLAMPVWRGASRHGEHGAILETGLDGTGAAHAAPSGAGTIQ